jgi:hypothetical protein
MNLLNLTSAQLKQAAKIKEQIVDLEKELLKLAGSVGHDVSSTWLRKGKRKMSDAGRLAIAAAQKLRWSEFRQKEKPKAKKRKTRVKAKVKMAAAKRAGKN